MTIPLTINVVPPVGPPPTTAFIDHAPTLALRDAMVAAHQMVADPGYVGFTGISDTTGFTTYSCANAQELYTALAALSTTATTKKLITCNWNGLSSWSGSSLINGPGTANLAAYVNGAADTGYNTPPHYTKVVAGGGFNPKIGGAVATPTESMNLTGWGYIEFDGIDFDKVVYFAQSPSRPTLPLVAVRNCTFSSLVYTQEARVAHIVDCVFDTNVSGSRFGAQYTRFWGNESRNRDKEGDFSTFNSLSQSYKATWEPQLWVAGNILHSMDEFLDGSNHYDLLQYGVGVQANLKQHMLVEFNIFDNNAPATQAFFADGSPSLGGPTYQVNICCHNNIITVNAFWAALGKDGAGTGQLRFYRNTCLRAAGKTVAQDTSARIAIIVSDNQAGPTTGVYELRENYANSLFVDAAMAPRTTQADNLIITNTAGANYVVDKFTGNGTWSNAVNPPYLTYNEPGQGLSRAAAFTAKRNFFQPVGGYRVAGVGCLDPATWPAAGAAW